jgi:phospholipase/carboxylesterase
VQNIKHALRRSRFRRTALGRGPVMTVPLETIEVVPREVAQWAVVWLHGLGADGRDFEPLVPALELPLPTRFVFPHAPVRAVTINGGMRMRAWYDIVALDRSASEDEAGMRASAAGVAALIEREIERGIAPAHIVLAGFSQGGAVALHCGLRDSHPLGGILALSTYLPLARTLAAEKSDANAAVPLFMAHGTADPVVAVDLALGSKRLLEAEGYDIEWHAYPMGHAVCPAEVLDIKRWLRELQNPRR